MARPVALLMADVATIMLASGDSTPHFEGEENLRALAVPPRCVWVSTVDEPSEDLWRGGVNPRPIFAFDEHVDVHCWGATRDAAYELRNAVLRAVKASVKAAATAKKSGWLRTNRDSWVEKGHVYVLHLALEAVPVPDEAAGEVTIESVEHTGDMGFPSGDQTGCSG